MGGEEEKGRESRLTGATLFVVENLLVDVVYAWFNVLPVTQNQALLVNKPDLVTWTSRAE